MIMRRSILLVQIYSLQIVKYLPKRAYNNLNTQRGKQCIMIDQIKESLKIKDSAIVLIPFITFTFTTQEELATMLEDCRDMSHKDINKYVYRKRRAKIASRPYSSLYSFIEQCKENKRKALEDLFQEPLNISKYDLLADMEPSEIYSIHSRQPADIGYTKFIYMFT